MKKITLIILILIFSIFTINLVGADNNKCQNIQSLSIEDIGKCLTDLGGALDASQKATAPLQSQLNNLATQLKGIEQRVSFLENDLATKRKFIDNGYKELEKQKGIFNQTVRDYYIKNSFFSPILVFISSVDASNITKILAYQKKGADQDKLIITNIALKLTDLEDRKAKLEEEERGLSVVKNKLAKEKVDIEKVVNGALAYQSTLSSQIAALSAKQQDILNQRLGDLNIPRSAGTSARGCTDDRGVDPGFSPRLAFFTYGAPHRNGLNQYGAFGRAKDGQNEEQILSAYYPNMSLKKDYDRGAQINVDGYGNFSIEEYTKRIYEVPESWGDQGGMAALKAQAVAARTYALNSQQRNGHICTTEACQVFHQEPKTGKWAEAVNATAGWVLMDGGSPGFTQYASTHGGYILNLGKFDGRVGNPTNFSELNDRAYDKESPWFYCDWGARGDKKTAWLRPEEVADIANVLLLVQKDSGIKEHLYQPDKPNPAGTDTWDPGRVKQELSNRGGTPFNSISSTSVDWDKGSGKTTNVTISGDGGTVSFSGSDFKTYFNLRAPANIQIVGPLFNIEH